MSKAMKTDAGTLPASHKSQSFEENLSPKDLEAIDALQIRYIRALDRQDMHAWADCFIRNGASYKCISRENLENDLSLCIMFDDNNDRIRDRIQYVTKVWSGTFEDYNTRHFIQRLATTRDEAGNHVAETSMMVAYTTTAGQSEILVSGYYQDTIAVNDEEAAFISKVAVLDTTVTPRYLVYPV